MEKAYKNVAFFFILILGFVIWGFYRTYFGLFPSFTGITTVQHFHGAMMLSWFALLIVQPFLIRAHKYELHKKIGKISYVVVPLLLFSIFLISKASYNKLAAILPKEQSIGSIALNIPNLFAFATLYILAMVNRKNSASHMRYIIGTSLLLISPGIGRAFIIYGGMPFTQGVNYALFITEMVAAGLIVYDFIKANSVNPYVITLLIIIAVHLIFHFQSAGWWQAFGGKFAQLFF